MLKFNPTEIYLMNKFLTEITPFQTLVYNPVEELEHIIQDLQHPNIKQKHYSLYSFGYALINYLHWLVSNYSIPQLGKMFTSSFYYEPTPSEEHPACCVLGALFNDPAGLPRKLNLVDWKFLCHRFGKEVNPYSERHEVFFNVLPALLLDKEALSSIQKINDMQCFPLRDFIEECMYRYLEAAK